MRTIKLKLCRRKKIKIKIGDQKNEKQTNDKEKSMKPKASSLK